MVERLHAAWEKTQIGEGGDGEGPESDARKEITDIILDELMPLRYKEYNEPDQREKELARLKQMYQKTSEVVGAVRSFRDFLSKNGSNLESQPHLRPPTWSVLAPDAIVGETTTVCKPPQSWELVDSTASDSSREHGPNDDWYVLVE